MTELQTLKKKKKEGKATPEDLTRLKQLQDGEPLSANDLEIAKQREADRKANDKAAYDARQKEKTGAITTGNVKVGADVTIVKDPSLDIPPDHPRIMEIKRALTPFTKIEVHDSRPNEFVLFTRGVAITAGDVRAARKAMKL